MIDGSPLVSSGFAVLDKPAGVTSYTFLSKAARRLGDGVKAGHAGTLDSFASGVLVCLFGRYTRLSDVFMGAGKGYEADVLLGEETDTLDPEGRVVATGAIPSRSEIEAALPSFRGAIMQSPPAYSAVHVDGERSYKRALKGQPVEPAARPVTISSLELLSYEGAVARIRVACSKGTYIRSLARDLALACGTRGRLSALRRTFSGPFRAEEALLESALEPSCLRRLTEADAASLGLGLARLGAEEARAFSYGLPIFRLASFSALEAPSPLAVFDEAGECLGIVARSGGAWKYACVLGSGA